MRWILVAAALPLAGCVASPPDVDAARLTADAVGLHDAVLMRGSRDPLDVTGPLPTPLAVAEAGELAVRNSPDVQAALAEVRASLADAKQARLLSNPVLDLNVRFGGETEVIEAGLAQPLVDLLSRPVRSRIADARLRAAAQRTIVAALEALRDAEQSHAQAVAADARLAVLQERNNLLDRLLDIAESRRRAGEASALDVGGFRARRAALDAEAIGVRLERRTARLTLLRLVGRPSGNVELSLDADDETAPVTAEHDYIRTALSVRPEVQAETFELAALGDEVTLAGFAPFDALAAGVETETEDETSVGPAVSVPIPIFDFGTQGKRRARAQVLAARHRLTGIARQVVEEVRQAHAAAVAADKRVVAVEDSVLPLQRERVERTFAAYRAGFADLTDVLAAEQDLLAAEAELIDARLQRRVARADLRRASGGVARSPLPTTQPTP